MKKTALITSISIVGLTVLSGFSILNSTGYSGATGSPADGGLAGSCGGCHSGGVSAPGITITSNPAFGTGNKYTPGATYTISILGSGYTKYGFDFEILNSQSATATSVSDFGTFGSAPAGETKNAPIASYPYSDIMHNTPKAGAFTVIWTAPASGTGYLYCAILGANMNGTTSGDRQALQTMTLTPNVATNIQKNTSEESTINLSIYPNPCTEKLYLSYYLKESSLVKAYLYNSSGLKVIEAINENQSVGANELSIDIPSHIPRGDYFVKIAINEKSLVKKVIIK